MKKIAIFGIFAIALLACIGFTACNNDVVETPEPETYTVNLGWAGEILDVSYEPMTRAANEDLYGIQVYSLPKNSSSTNWAPYAYGLFDDPNNITITLSSGYKYKFVASMIKDEENRLYNNSTSDGYKVYDYPFIATLNNKFQYDVAKEMISLAWGKSYLREGNSCNIYDRPNIERFYGELSDYIPEESNTNAKINMRRTSFGAKFVAGGSFAVDGKLMIQIDEAPKMELALTEDADQISDIFSFMHIAKAWENNNYTEDISVNFIWVRADETEAPMGTHTITFRRNTTTVVKVNIEKDGNDENLGIDIDDSETGIMPDGEEVTITDGEVVDTEVGTN